MTDKPGKIQPVAWMVTRDTEYESREYFKTEQAAIDNSRFGVVDSHVTPLISASQVRSLLEAKAREWQERRQVLAGTYEVKSVPIEAALRCADELLVLAATLGEMK